MSTTELPLLDLGAGQQTQEIRQSLRRLEPKHARYYWLLLAESHLTRRRFGTMLQRIWALPVPTG
jgi:hypothetical protein